MIENRPADTSLRWLAALLLSAAALRLTGLGWGLPSLFNGDEPHIIDTAVYFGSGTLKPPLLKYPTGYMYLLAFLYGLWFLAMRALGLVQSVAGFEALFVWRPTGFYMIGRVVSALSGLAALWVVYRAARAAGDRGAGLWAAALLAAAPVLNVSDHAAKPDSLMVLLSAAAGLSALRWIQHGGRRWAALCGASIGLACGVQYTAAPLAALLPAAFWMRGRDPKGGGFGPEWGPLAAAAGAALAAAFAASPYVFLDPKLFLSRVGDLSALERQGSAVPSHSWLLVLENAALFAGWGAVPFLAWGLWKSRDARLVWLAPIAAWLLVLGPQGQGSVPRYLLGAYPFLALAAGTGLQNLAARRSWAPWVLGLCLLPGLAAALAFDRDLTLPDTRLAAQRWLEANAPPGSVLLLDSPEHEPQPRMSREQAEDLYRRTVEAGHPRSRFFRIMADSHPGGGYRLLRIKRDAADLGTYASHVAWSQQAQDLLDLSEGLEAARLAGVDYLILSSYGVRPERARNLARFFDEIGRLQPEASFLPEPGRVAGPEIRIYRLK